MTNLMTQDIAEELITSMYTHLEISEQYQHPELPELLAEVEVHPSWGFAIDIPHKLKAKGRIEEQEGLGLRFLENNIGCEIRLTHLLSHRWASIYSGHPDKDSNFLSSLKQTHYMMRALKQSQHPLSLVGRITKTYQNGSLVSNTEDFVITPDLLRNQQFMNFQIIENYFNLNP